MRNNLLKKSVILIAALAFMLAMTACTVDPSDDGSDMDTITVTMNIDYPNGSDDAHDKDYMDHVDDDFAYTDEQLEDIEGYKMQVEHSATVMQILQSFANQENIPLLFDTSYVVSIGNVNADDDHGWIFIVNDNDRIRDAATDYVAEDGDVITWRYIEY